MTTDETMGAPPESYTGEQIDSIQIIGGRMSFQREVKILLKDGNHITIKANMNISGWGIVPHMSVQRGKWGRIPNKP